jgi:hypothetical protein
MKVLLIALAMSVAMLGATSPAMAQATGTTGTVVMSGGYGGYPYGEVGTPYSSALKGWGKALEGAGYYNKETSEATINLLEAQRMAMENSIRYVETYFRLQQINHDLRFPPGSRLSPDEMVRLNKALGPRPLSPGEFDRVSGQIYWPELLQSGDFGPQRSEVQSLFTRWVTTGTFGLGGYAEVRRAIEIMMEELRDQVRVVPTDQYVDSRRFLEGLTVEARNPLRPRPRTPLISSLPPVGMLSQTR